MKHIRHLIRNKEITSSTTGLAKGYVQTNVVIISKEHSEDFRKFCMLNPKSCPFVYESKPGETYFEDIAADSDIRLDVGRYKIFEYGKFTKETNSLLDIWRNDYVTFLLGCSFTFENALIEDGLKLRHNEYGINIPMYITNIKCKPSGVFEGNTVVSMRPFKKKDISKVYEITGQYPDMHGTPLFVCYSLEETKEYGIKDILTPDFGYNGKFYDLEKDDVFAFWGCGVTPQLALENAKLDIAITHYPGYMFIIDKKDQDYRKKVDITNK